MKLFPLCRILILIFLNNVLVSKYRKKVKQVPKIQYKEIAFKQKSLDLIELVNSVIDEDRLIISLWPVAI